jgi:hypothetical protein
MTNTKLFDKLKTNGKIYYAFGEFRKDKVGKAFAEKEATRIRNLGGHARIITRKTGYQVYSESKYI